MGDTTPIPAPSRGLLGSAHLTVQVKFVPGQPLLPWQRKNDKFNRKLAITRLILYHLTRGAILTSSKLRENVLKTWPYITLWGSGEGGGAGPH